MESGERQIQKDENGNRVPSQEQERTRTLKAEQRLKVTAQARQLADDHLDRCLASWPHTGDTTNQTYKVAEEDIINTFISGAENLSKAQFAPEAFANRGAQGFRSHWKNARNAVDEEAIDFAHNMRVTARKYRLGGDDLVALLNWIPPQQGLSLRFQNKPLSALANEERSGVRR